MKKYTQTQGQYLAFIDTYTRLNHRSPAQSDIQSYFGVTPPTVHQMILRLENLGLIERTPGQARSIKLKLNSTELPELK